MAERDNDQTGPRNISAIDGESVTRPSIGGDLNLDERSTQKGVTYAYEALLDEHFQHLVQALLLLEYPGLQCLPVGMPDGGRDAFVMDRENIDIVFQVKFARNPSQIRDTYDWVTTAFEREKENIAHLASRGAKKYILVTNVPGTSHLDSGLIDKVAKYLRDDIDIASQCLWRDDLDRRLDGAYSMISSLGSRIF